MTGMNYLETSAKPISVKSQNLREEMLEDITVGKLFYVSN